MEKKILISVIVPVYNVEDYIAECIESILNQDYKNIEVILVNDGATDMSGKICDEYADKYSFIKVIHKRNGGLSSARNEGLKHISGDYISFVDADDYLEPKTYSSLLEANKNYGADIVCMARFLNYADGAERIINRLDCYLELNKREYLKAVFNDKHIDMSVCDKIFKRKVFQGVVFPVGYLSEDILVLPSIVSNMRSALLTGIPLYHYRQHENTITKSFNPKYYETYQQFDAIEEIILRNYQSIISDFQIFKLTFLCHIFMLLQTYGCSSVKVKNDIEKEFKRNVKVLLLGNKIPRRIRIQAFFLLFNLGSFYTLLKAHIRKIINHKKRIEN